jgi:hypothetical protein
VLHEDVADMISRMIGGGNAARMTVIPERRQG